MTKRHSKRVCVVAEGFSPRAMKVMIALHSLDWVISRSSAKVGVIPSISAKSIQTRYEFYAAHMRNQPHAWRFDPSSSKETVQFNCHYFYYIEAAPQDSDNSATNVTLLWFRGLLFLEPV